MQKIFSRNPDYNKIAFLNWRISKGDDIINLLNLADGFLQSSIELAKVCLQDNKDKKADILIFPILHNANHGIELYLKALNWILNKIMDNGYTFEKGHNIKKLLATVRSRITIYKGNIKLKEFDDSTKELAAYINELFLKIEASDKSDKMDFSRYPFSKNDDSHFYVMEIGNVEIDLENYVHTFENIKEKIETISDYLYHQELQQDW